MAIWPGIRHTLPETGRNKLDQIFQYFIVLIHFIIIIPLTHNRPSPCNERNCDGNTSRKLPCSSWKQRLWKGTNPHPTDVYFILNISHIWLIDYGLFNLSKKWVKDCGSYRGHHGSCDQRQIVPARNGSISGIYNLDPVSRVLIGNLHLKYYGTREWFIQVICIQCRSQ